MLITFPGTPLGEPLLHFTERAMATHSSTLAWKIPWTEEPCVHGVAKSQTRLSGFTFTFFSFLDDSGVTQGPLS